MASKKAKSAKPKSQPKAKSQPKPAKKLVVRERLAAKLLATLPALNDVRRRAYESAFTVAQCETWGDRTKAEHVLADAERAVGTVAKAVETGMDGYPPHRLSWLCSLMVELQDSIARQSGEEVEGVDVRAGRSAAVAQAKRVRVKLAHGLMSVVAGNEAMQKVIADRNQSQDTPSVLETSITGLLQVALQVRRTPEGEVLANDAGLTEEFLSAASAMAESLSKANEATYGASPGHDSVETNRIEGRVLRELNHLRMALGHAKERGLAVPAFPTLATLKTAAGNQHEKKVDPPPPPPAS